MIWWAILTGVLIGTLWAEAWIYLRDKATQPRHSNQGEGKLFDWLLREPTDLDQLDRQRRNKP
jgi:hypothetical protein